MSLGSGRRTTGSMGRPQRPGRRRTWHHGIEHVHVGETGERDGCTGGTKVDERHQKGVVGRMRRRAYRSRRKRWDGGWNGCGLGLGQEPVQQDER